ncbi:TIGR03808 family TAT-translocated repetitive protein [uncultured Devosia sp.]|uniref:TIGR03808 family TAT-translocated repetitive protein n=1 Tax=uncultured Devosia sp. TaxID=211434 RepID=UPI0035C9C7A6
MTKSAPTNRRTVLASMAAATLGTTLPGMAQSRPELVPDSGADQTGALQALLDNAAASGVQLTLPAGRILVRDLAIPGNVAIEGVPGRTVLAGLDGNVVATIAGAGSVVLRDIGFEAGANEQALLSIDQSRDVMLDRCAFRGGTGSGLTITGSAVTVRDCTFADHADAAIHALDNHGLLITGNTIAACGNAGIRIWRSEAGPDGAIVTQNRIAGIKAVGGGNGQNGNGINVFKAGGVIVADNHISDCAFTAIRLNATNDTQVSGNTCLNSGEVAIFSEFGFSGSVIANNIVDGAAGGISMTNFNEGGYLAVCTGNIVRNIAPLSRVNPDTTPFGISAEAEAAVTGNSISKVPGPAIAAGYGPYLRNVLVANNVMHDILIGIAVSVAPGAGPAHIANNLIFAPERAIVGMAWSDMVETDLIANASNYPQLTILDNTVGETPNN